MRRRRRARRARESGAGRAPRGAGSPAAASESRSLLLLYRVAAELGPQGGVDLRCERLVLARRESGVERERDYRYRDALVDRLKDGPAALAGVLDVVGDVGEVVAVLVDCVVEQ